MAKKDFDLIIKAKTLSQETIRITSNTNNFPKKYRFSLCNRLQEYSFEILENIVLANFADINDTKTRIQYQTNVITYCELMLFLVEACIDLKIISIGCAERWSSLISGIKYMTISWRKKDKERTSA